MLRECRIMLRATASESVNVHPGDPTPNSLGAAALHRYPKLKLGHLPEAEWNRVNTPLHPYRAQRRFIFSKGDLSLMNKGMKKVSRQCKGCPHYRTAIDIDAHPIKHLKNDIALIKERDPAAKSTAEVLLLYSGLHAMFAYRIAHRLYLSEHYFAARMVSQIARGTTGIEIHPGATIGSGLFIDHGMGVVIGETTEIGNNCTLYQGVTLGGTGKDIGKRHPTLGDNVLVGAGARVLGPVNIGNGAKIASGAVVLKDVPENSTAVGIPAKVVRRDGERTELLDHGNIPDPVAKEINAMREKINALEAEMAELKAKKPTRSRASAKKDS